MRILLLLMNNAIFIIVLFLFIVIIILVKHHYRRRYQVRIIPYIVWLSRSISLIETMVIDDVFLWDDYLWSFIHLNFFWVLISLK